MTTGKPVSLATYEAIERVLTKAAMGEGNRWLAAACRRIEHPAGRTAASMLHHGNRYAALNLLARALERLAEAGALDAWRPHRVPDFKGVPEPRGPSLG